MPKRKVPRPSAAAVSAIREALKHGRPVSAEEAQELVSSRRLARDDPGKPEVVVVDYKNTGQLRFRIRSKKGAGTIDHPRWIANGEKANALLTDIAKLRRPLMLHRAKQQRSQTMVEKIRELLREHQALGRGAAQKVADELGVTADYIRRVRKRPKPT